MPRGAIHPIKITSSAVASSLSGTVRPSILAARERRRRHNVTADPMSWVDLDSRIYYLKAMPRPSRFSEAQILAATAAIVAAEGPSGATIGAIGHMLKAPSGSIYHLFASRDVLLGRLWLSKAAFFQDRFAAALADPDPFKAGLAAALSMPRAVREDFAGARIMLL